MHKKTFAFLLFLALLTSYIPLAEAQTSMDYTLLEKIPGTNGISGSDLSAYISAIYKVALVVVTLSAVLMLSIGGFMYLTSAGNTSSISTAKGVIYDSIIGLVIALSAWLILYIINPDLVEITLNAPPGVEVTEYPPASLPSGSDQALATFIQNSGLVSLDNVGDCRDASGVAVTPARNIGEVASGKRALRCSSKCDPPERIACTETTPLSNKMLAAIASVAGPSGPGISFRINSISGGPHADNSKHYSGQAIDISSPVNSAAAQTLMDAFVAAGAVAPNGTATTSMCEKAIRDASGKIIRTDSVNCTNGGSNHLHLVFPN